MRSCCVFLREGLVRWAHGTISVLPAGEEERRRARGEEGGGGWRAGRRRTAYECFNVIERDTIGCQPACCVQRLIFLSLFSSGGEVKDVLDLLGQNLLSIFPPLTSYAPERLFAVYGVFRSSRPSSSSSSYFSCSCIVHQNDLVETPAGRA